ncbi:DUF862-domain-containing protein [Polychaeton citri CBS 116435]|uniref:DUF862-domain-containing protein n=1 Tax=Polychaeton citri CBS 116435 TaxID=1314669 RepID=A0A9P4Q3L2_9PEZI|nr:DUF862-domain-containing protein [Polychaeton citri CBS 116435]
MIDNRSELSLTEQCVPPSTQNQATTWQIARSLSDSKMEVQLYVYDLSRGMARALSQQFLGIQIDAVYHTSLVFDNVEHFYGAGVQTCIPGTTHHGQPMHIHSLGTTQFPKDTIYDYLESLKEVYTYESYDLFERNCNNFTNDFSMFLLGRGIPDHVTSLPKRVLETPFGQMLKPYLDSSMRSITQAPVTEVNRPRPAASSLAPTTGSVNNVASHTALDTKGKDSLFGSVIDVTTTTELERVLSSARDSAVVIFFTSSTCAPCKLVQPTFVGLAEENPRVAFVSVDTHVASQIAATYNIRATPTFMTFNKGAKDTEWTGADPGILESNVSSLLTLIFPPHPHSLLKVPRLQSGRLAPFTYSRIPPLDKLVAKLGDTARVPAISSLLGFVKNRASEAQNVHVPDLASIGKAYQGDLLSLPLDKRFAAIDLLRCAILDPRLSGFFAAEQPPRTVAAVVENVTKNESCPHNQRLVTLQLASNTFTSSLYVKELLRASSASAPLFVEVVTQSLLDASHPTTRVASARLALNLAMANYRMRREEGTEGLAESLQVELAASLSEALSQEASADASEALLQALGYLVFFAPPDGELLDLCKALDIKAALDVMTAHRELAKEVASCL